MMRDRHNARRGANDRARAAALAAAAQEEEKRREEESKLKSLVRQLPYELFIECLKHALLDQANVPKLLSLSKDLYEQLSIYAYATVTLSSVHTIEAFYNLLRIKTDLGRKVKSLWIGPTELHSDLIPALSPPDSVMCRSVNLREKVYVFTKFILRSCRKVEYLALSGGLCIPDAAFSYGTACQPKRLMCVNPHSFVGAFSAPMFNKVVELHLIDTSLAVEDGDEISKMQNLRHFIWSSPKEFTDPAQETGRIHRLVLQSLNGELPAGMANQFNNDSTASEFGLALTPNVASKLGTRAKQLERITLRTSQGRCVAFVRSIEPLEEMRMDLDDDGASMDSGVFFHNSSSTAAKKKQKAELSESLGKWIKVRTRSLEPGMIDEWQALQEEVCTFSYRWDDYRPSKLSSQSFLEGDDEGLADGKKALRIFHRQWLLST